jgi:hypothetical protein
LEFDSWQQNISIYEEGKLIDEGTYKNMKIKYHLKPYLLLYICYADQIYKLQLSGIALFSFGDYEKLFTENGSSFCLFYTNITTEKKRNNVESPAYFLPVFTNGGKIEDPKPFLIKLKELDETLRLYEEAKKEKDNERKEDKERSYSWEKIQTVEKPSEIIEKVESIKIEKDPSIAQDALRIFG